MAKLGTNKRPAVVRVQSMEEADEIVEVAEQNGWKVIVGVEPDEPEDTTDLDELMCGESTPLRLEPKIGRNDPCWCGSGHKFKKCCARS